MNKLGDKGNGLQRLKSVICNAQKGFMRTTNVDILEVYLYK